MSLVDKLNDVHVGDIVKLSNINISVVGYVWDYSIRKIELSHEDPKALGVWHTKEEASKTLRNCFGPPGGKILKGNRIYDLRKFDVCETLKKYEAPKKE